MGFTATLYMTGHIQKADSSTHDTIIENYFASIDFRRINTTQPKLGLVLFGRKFLILQSEIFLNCKVPKNPAFRFLAPSGRVNKH